MINQIDSTTAQEDIDALKKKKYQTEQDSGAVQLPGDVVLTEPSTFYTTPTPYEPQFDLTTLRRKDIQTRLPDSKLEFIVQSDTGQTVDASTQPIEESPDQRIKYPDVILTDSFLNDQIQFNTEVDFFPDVIVPQTEDLPQYDRDIAQFTIVPIHGMHSLSTYSILTKSPVSDRDAVSRVIVSEFTEF